MTPFCFWWQHIPQRINPNLLVIGSFQLRYYGLMYILAFLTSYLLALYRLKTEKTVLNKEIIQRYFFWAILATLVGGRLGYVLFYNLNYYLRYPLEIFLPFEFSAGLQYSGIYGMSYHGGLLGVIFATVLFCRKYKISFCALADFFSAIVPLGYTFGRLGNFINGELYGRPTRFILGMYFRQDPLNQLRHPSQLYEAFFEGIVLFFLLWSIRKKNIFPGFLFSLYLVGYGLLRFLAEFFREPDPQIGLLFGGLTLGQIFCLAMVLAGLIILGIKIRQAHGKNPAV